MLCVKIQKEYIESYWNNDNRKNIVKQINNGDFVAYKTYFVMDEEYYNSLDDVKKNIIKNENNNFDLNLISELKTILINKLQLNNNNNNKYFYINENKNIKLKESCLIYVGL